MLAPSDEELSPGARYTRLWRARERAGKILLKLEQDEAELVVGLVAQGLLDPNVADRRDAVNAAAAKALVQFCRGDVSRHAERISASVRVALLLRALRNASTNDRRRKNRRR